MSKELIEHVRQEELKNLLFTCKMVNRNLSKVNDERGMKFIQSLEDQISKFIQIKAVK